MVSLYLPLCSARKSKTHIFLPWAVTRDGKSGGGKEEGSGGETKAKMSNEEFRKLLYANSTLNVVTQLKYANGIMLTVWLGSVNQSSF